uniref:Uncharacterized protein n=1 Tax=Strigamia maritima TaxID=126957 RepID=T1IQ62_STRMM
MSQSTGAGFKKMFGMEELEYEEIELNEYQEAWNSEWLMESLSALSDNHLSKYRRFAKTKKKDSVIFFNFDGLHGTRRNSSNIVNRWTPPPSSVSESRSDANRSTEGKRICIRYGYFIHRYFTRRNFIHNYITGKPTPAFKREVTDSVFTSTSRPSTTLKYGQDSTDDSILTGDFDVPGDDSGWKDVLADYDYY